MSKLIIHNEAGVSDQVALGLVANVIGEGRISDDGRSFCYLTVFKKVEGVGGEITVSSKSRRLRDGSPSDSFFVWNR